jgi:hypothetical protein
MDPTIKLGQVKKTNDLTGLQYGRAEVDRTEFSLTYTVYNSFQRQKMSELILNPNPTSKKKFLINLYPQTACRDVNNLIM